MTAGHELFQAALRDSAETGQPAGPMRVVETHASWVVLAGQFAYKIKKAVDLGFLDFSSLSRRKHYCEEELRLNRRLAPELYLGQPLFSPVVLQPPLTSFR